MYVQINVRRYKGAVRYGIMHIIATNLCVWLIALVDEIFLDVMELPLEELGHEGKCYISLTTDISWIRGGIRPCRANSIT